jgi:hypothetical protein
MYIHLSQIAEVWDTPQQKEHHHILGSLIKGSFLFRQLGDYKIIKLNFNLMKVVHGLFATIWCSDQQYRLKETITHVGKDEISCLV